MEDIHNLKFKDQAKAIWYFIDKYPAQCAVQTFILIFAGFAEAISIATLLPILNFALKGAADTETTLGRWITDFFEFAGFPLELSNLLILFVFLVFLKSLLLFISMKKVGEIAASIAEDFRTQVIRNLLNVKWSFFIKQKTGDLAAAMTSEIEKSAGIFIQTGRIASYFFQVIIYLFFALQTSGLATFSALAVSGFLIFGLRKFINIARQAGARQTQTQQSLLANVSESFSSFKLIKAMGLESKVSETFSENIASLRDITVKKIISKEGVKNIQEPFYFLAIALGINYATKYKLFPTPESLFIVVLLFYRTVQRLGELQKSYRSLVTNTPGFYFVKNLISNCKNAYEKKSKGSNVEFTRSIVLQDISFSYGENEILVNANAEIPYGKFVSFYGGSGTGKTTTIDLLVGLLKPKSGQILIDDVPLSSIDEQKWKEQISYVSQDSFLFNDSIRNNITFKESTFSDDDIINSLKLAGAWNFVAKLPKGLDSIVEERGSNFSGGQKQRLTIARALIRKPKLIILDESTTGLDPKTELEIIETLKNLAGETTILAISHQSAIKKASEIVFKLENKNIKKI